MLKFWGKKETASFDYSMIGADMHSHILPGIDDGSPDFATSVQLINGLAELGFKKLITTPHIMWDMYKNTNEIILKKYDELQEYLLKEGIKIDLKVAAEYFLDGHMLKLIESKVPFLTIHDNLVLIEFSMASEPLDLKEILFEMQMQGYQPIIAHPERYVYHERNKRFFEELKDAGYIFQLNIMSLAGAYGKGVNELAKYFIKNQYYELAGTDLHNPNHINYLKSPAITPHLQELINSGKLMNPEF